MTALLAKYSLGKYAGLTGAPASAAATTPSASSLPVAKKDTPSTPLAKTAQPAAAVASAAASAAASTKNGKKEKKEEKEKEKPAKAASTKKKEAAPASSSSSESTKAKKPTAAVKTPAGIALSWILNSPHVRLSVEKERTLDIVVKTSRQGLMFPANPLIAVEPGKVRFTVQLWKDRSTGILCLMDDTVYSLLYPVVPFSEYIHLMWPYKTPVSTATIDGSVLHLFVDLAQAILWFYLDQCDFWKSEEAVQIRDALWSVFKTIDTAGDKIREHIEKAEAAAAAAVVAAPPPPPPPPAPAAPKRKETAKQPAAEEEEQPKRKRSRLRVITLEEAGDDTPATQPLALASNDPPAAATPASETSTPVAASAAETEKFVVIKTTYPEGIVIVTPDTAAATSTTTAAAAAASAASCVEVEDPDMAY